MKQINWLSPLLSVGILIPAGTVLAHGAHISYTETRGIQIVATYEQGKPMSNAQVTIYAPEDPATPWLKGETDSQGVFSFVPDLNQPGNWDVQVRQAGHGAMLSIPIGAVATTSETPEPEVTLPVNNVASGYTFPQKVVMIASTVWGLVGTALFFARQPAKS